MGPGARLWGDWLRSDELSLLEVESAVRHCRGPGIVSYHYDGLTVITGEGREEVEYGSGRLAVEVAGRFIGHEEPWIVHNSPGNGDTLFLSTGEFGGTVVGSVGEPHEVKGDFNPPPALTAGERLQEEGKFDILVSGEDGDEVIELEDVAHLEGSPPCELGAGKVPEVLPVNEEFPTAGSVNAGDEIEQGGLSGTGWSHQGEKLAPGDFETQLLQGRDKVRPLAEGLRQIADLDEGGGHW